MIARDRRLVALRLGAYNALWIALLTVNTRIVTGHAAGSLVLVVIFQLLLSFVSFTLIKSIQHVHNRIDKLAFCLGGCLGAALGMLVTGWVR